VRDDIAAHFLSLTVDDILKGIGPKAHRDSLRVLCNHSAFLMERQMCLACGMTKQEALQART